MTLFTIPYSENFLKFLAHYILSKACHNPLFLIDHTLVLPSERAGIYLEKELISQSPSQALVMPKIKALSSWSQSKNSGLKILSPLQRHLLLANLLQDKTSHSWQECLALSTSLMKLLDEFYTEELSLEKLEDLVPVNLSDHWQKSLDILRILFHEWPRRLQMLGLIESIPARNQALHEQSEQWKDTAPSGPFIMAGIVGSVPHVGRFLKAVSHLPKSEIIFMGLDLEMSEVEWQELPAYHPQFSHRQTLERMAYTRNQVQCLTSSYPNQPILSKAPSQIVFKNETLKSTRSQFFKNLFHSEGLEKSFQEEFDSDVLKTIQLLEPMSIQEEARLIALMIREGLDRHTGDIALITPHRGLCDRVTAELRRWQIIPNDSYGQTLYESAQGSFLALILNVIFQPLNTVAILSLLKHPLTRLGMHPADCRKMTRLLEIQHFRTLTPFETFNSNKIEEATLHAFYQKFQEALSPLLQGPFILAEWVDRHQKTFEALTQDLEGIAEDLRLQPMGQEISDLFHHLKGFSSPQHLFTLSEYSSLLTTHLRSLRMTKNYGMHPRVHFLGILEARLLRFDLIILGSLNDLHWSPGLQQNPWLSYDMKQRLGMPDERYYGGLTAENWLGLMHASEVVMTRAQREGGMTMLPSRWLMRLKAVLKAQNLLSLLKPQSPWHRWAYRLDRPSSFSSPSLLPAPAPCPPMALRPRKLSVTEVQLWLQDPYALYAKRILNLAPLPLLEKEITPALFGIVVHRALEQYIRSTSDRQTRDQLLLYGQQGFGPIYENLLIQNLWWPRFIRLSDWFLEMEQKKRQGIYRSWTEIKGHLTFDTAQGPFTIHAKADRIDVHHDRTHEIIDYKTGSLPTRKDIFEGTAVQLPLEGAISQHGTWERMTDPSSLKSFSFWQLKGSLPAGDIINFPEAPSMSESAFNLLRRLVDHYEQPTTPYPADPRASNDYDALARRQEWRTRGL